MYLKAQGPDFVRQMPRGYVIELVQLLLNTNVLHFRKGRVSFASKSPPSSSCVPCSLDGAPLTTRVCVQPFQVAGPSGPSGSSLVVPEKRTKPPFFWFF